MLNITKHYKLWFGFSAVLMIAMLAAVLSFGLQLGIDFTGGTLTQVTFNEQDAPSNAQIQTVLRTQNIHEFVIQPSDDNSVIIRTGPQEKEEHDALLAALSQEFGELTEDQFTSIGPVIGRELRNKAYLQLGLVTLGIILYIAYAFRKVARPVSSWKFGWTAIIALIHDLVIVIGVFAILGHYYNVQVDTLFVTALLTVLGFSVHDTIVVFDRIRENLRLRAGQSLSEIINSSVNQTLVRSINTTMTVVFVLVALLLFGGETIRYFVLALLVGVVAGTYSSIFIASPMLLVWQRFTRNRD